jgi:hypothetical protein
VEEYHNKALQELGKKNIYKDTNLGTSEKTWGIWATNS